MNAYNNVFGSHFFERSLAVCALCATLALPAFGQEGAGSEVDMTDYGTVNLTVKDTDLATVLEMLSIESEKNIITSKAVSATVTANLYDVTFYEALDAILLVNGYRWVEEGNFIYIYTNEEYKAIQEQNRRRESRIFTLDHISAAAAHEIVSPLLSDSGKSSFIGDSPIGFQPSISDGGADEWAYTPKLVVNDYPENLDAIAELLAELDTDPMQVLVEATILQSQLNEANAFGVDFSAIGSLDFTNLTNPLSGVGDLITGNATGPGTPASGGDGFEPADNRGIAVTSNPGNVGQGAGTLKLGIVHNDVSIFLRVLDEVTDNTVLARPKVMCLNRQRAEVLVGARVGYLSTTATETSSTQSVEFLDTGIHLVFRPFISSNGTIRMELSPSVSEASLRTVTDSQGLQVTIPDELTNELTSNVRVKDGQTLVLGGLSRESTRVARRQVPVLGDIPIVGAAFRGQDDAVDRSEIIFLITPTIVKDQSLWAMGEESTHYIDAARVGARAGLLPFSREKMTANYNQDAHNAHEAGDDEKALYYINNSLRLNPAQPDMVRMRNELAGDSDGAYKRSILQRVIDQELGRSYSAQARPAGTVVDAQPFAQSSDPFGDQWQAFANDDTTESGSDWNEESPEADFDTFDTFQPQAPTQEPETTFESNDWSEPTETGTETEVENGTETGSEVQPVDPQPQSPATDEQPQANPSADAEDSTASAAGQAQPSFGPTYQTFMKELFAMLGLPDLVQDAIAKANTEASATASAQGDSVNNNQ